MFETPPAWIRVAVAALVLCVGPQVGCLAGCSAGPAAGERSAQGAWAALLQRQPYPHLLPLAEPRRSLLDGTYAKVAAVAAERVHCRRCPDYAPEGGAWKLNLSRGVFRILHTESGWKSMGTCIVAGDRILLANDPVCIDALGLYRWRMGEGQLVFEEIDDPCAIGLRARNLAGQTWRSCRPPNMEAAVTGHWPQPEGCGDDSDD